MYRKQQRTLTTINKNDSVEGETIETKIRRITNNREPITDGAELIYGERNKGVDPATDPRTDKWEIAINAMEQVYQTKQGIIKEKMKSPAEKEADKIAIEIAKEAKKNMGKEGENLPQNN